MPTAPCTRLHLRPTEMRVHSSLGFVLTVLIACSGPLMSTTMAETPGNASASSPASSLASLGKKLKIDPTFRPPVFRMKDGGGGFFSAMQEPGGRIYVHGVFDTVDRMPHVNLARLLPNGSLDYSYRPKLESRWMLVAMLPDSTLFTAHVEPLPGPRKRFPSQEPKRTAMARWLDRDGEYTRSSLYARPTEALNFQPEGDVLLSFGNAKGPQDDGPPLLERRRADFTLDAAFSSAIVARDEDSAGIAATYVQADGKILIQGYRYPLPPDPYLLGSFRRLLPDGREDLTFRPDMGEHKVQSVHFLPDGNLAVICWGEQHLGTPLLIMDANGKQKGRFYFPRHMTKYGFERPNSIDFLRVQENGDLVGLSHVEIVGSSEISERYPHVFWRARAKGNSFEITEWTPFPMEERPNSLTLLSDGSVLITGDPTGETRYDERSYIIRLLPDEPAYSSVRVLDAHPLHWVRGGSAPAVSQVLFQLSKDEGHTWTNLGRGERPAGSGRGQWVLALDKLSLPNEGLIKALGKVEGTFVQEVQRFQFRMSQASER